MSRCATTIEVLTTTVPSYESLCDVGTAHTTTTVSTTRCAVLAEKEYAGAILLQGCVTWYYATSFYAMCGTRVRYSGTGTALVVPMRCAVLRKGARSYVATAAGDGCLVRPPISLRARYVLS
eukprot:448088-Rhodomonas_salina.5